jgi:hypothetical protein
MACGSYPTETIVLLWRAPAMLPRVNAWQAGQRSNCRLWRAPAMLPRVNAWQAGQRSNCRLWSAAAMLPHVNACQAGQRRYGVRQLSY